MTLLPDILKMLIITQKAITYDKTTQEAIENMSFIEFVHQLSLGTQSKLVYFFNLIFIAYRGLSKGRIP